MWTRDTWGEDNLGSGADQNSCSDRKGGMDGWCGVTDLRTFFVAPALPPTTTPTPTATPEPPVTSPVCSFEDAKSSDGLYCGLWKDDTQGVQHLWQRGASTPSTRTGPSQAPYGQNFLYIEASDPRQPGDVARLRSVGVYLRSGATLSFGYHMYGDTIGTLKVSVVKGGASKTVWTWSGEIDGRWYLASMDLDQFGFSSTELAEITIEGIRGNGWTSDIAIDGLVLSNYALTPLPATTPQPPPTTTPTTTPQPPTIPGCWIMTPSGCSGQSSYNAQEWTRDTWGEANLGSASNQDVCLKRRKAESDAWCGDTDTRTFWVAPSSVATPASTCTFEGQVNGVYCDTWSDDSDRPIKFTRASPSSCSTIIAPPAADSDFLYLNTEWAWMGETASLVSKPVTLGSGALLSFSYNMNGGSVGALTVGLDTGSSKRVLWSMSGHQGYGWKPATVDVSSGGVGARVYIEATVGCRANNGIVDTGLDNVDLQLGDTSRVVANSVAPPAPQVTGGCVAPKCVSCSFEEDADKKTDSYCGHWKIDRTANALWTKHSQATPTSFTGPVAASAGDYYLYLEASSPANPGDTVRLMTETFKPGPNAPSLSFDYNMRGDDIGTLRVNVISNNKVWEVWSMSKDQGWEWKNAKVDLQFFANYDIKIVIDGEKAAGWEGDIALDNIVLESGDGHINPCPNSSQKIVFTLDSAEGQVDVSESSSVFGAIRLQLPQVARDIVKSEVGDATLQKALLTILGRTTEILATCSSADTLDALCPHTRAARNITSVAKNTSGGNLSLHVDFRTKIRFGNSEDARLVLTETARIETGNVDTLSEAATEIELAFTRLNISFLSITPVVVLKTPQPRQLKYKTSLLGENGESPSIQARADEEDESDISLGAIEAVGVAVALVIIGVLVIILGVRYNRRRQAHKNSCDNGQKAQKVDPNPDADDAIDVDDAVNAPSSPEPPCATAPSELQKAPTGSPLEELQDAAGTDSFTLHVDDDKPVVETISKASLETSDSIEHGCNSQQVLLGISKASLGTAESLEAGCHSGQILLGQDTAETSTMSGLASETVSLGEDKSQEDTFAC